MDQSAATLPLKPKDYRSALKPVWCPGCGDFAVLNAITKALAFMELPREQVALITGIGCSSRIAAYGARLDCQQADTPGFGRQAVSAGRPCVDRRSVFYRPRIHR